MKATFGIVAESVSRYCGFWKSKDGKWWMDLARDEYGEHEDAVTYGPFTSMDAAERYLKDNFSNPGGYDEDDSGTRPAPTVSPNGEPVVRPRSGSQWVPNPMGRRWR